MRAFIDIVRTAASTPEILRFALKMSAAIGPVPNLINQGERVIEGGEFSLRHGVLNFAVPCCVSAFSGGRNELRMRADAGRPCSGGP